MIMKEKERKEDKDKKKDEREEKNERELARMTRKSRIVRQITMSKCLRDDKDQIRREVLVRSGALDEIICELMFERESRTSSLEFLRELRTVAENISNRLVVVHDNDGAAQSIVFALHARVYFISTKESNFTREHVSFKAFTAHQRLWRLAINSHIILGKHFCHGQTE